MMIASALGTCIVADMHCSHRRSRISCASMTRRLAAAVPTYATNIAGSAKDSAVHKGSSENRVDNAVELRRRNVLVIATLRATLRITADFARPRIQASSSVTHLQETLEKSASGAIAASATSMVT